jgi:hypothetical protein
VESKKRQDHEPTLVLSLLILEELCGSLVALAARYTNPVVAGAAIDRAIVLRQEWHLRLHSTFGADHRVHFARATLRAPTPTGYIAARSATRGTPARLIQQAFLLVKLLLTSGEYEIISAFATLQGFVFEIQTRDLLVI